MDAIRDEMRLSGSAAPIRSRETVLDARAQELAATDVPLKEITGQFLRMQVKLIRSVSYLSPQGFH
ncbi:MAG TPA: hypothetical protein VFQ68_35435 [Streptosporangiaceae bacterium]|nr:hypothetical protein [Streptosporangiaceae bacterium]